MQLTPHHNHWIACEGVNRAAKSTRGPYILERSVEVCLLCTDEGLAVIESCAPAHAEAAAARYRRIIGGDHNVADRYELSPA